MQPNGTMLIDIGNVPETYRSVFASYPAFNRVQSTVFHDILNSDHSVVLSAPTGSGKTVLFELAIIRQLMISEKSKYSNIFQIIYISPMKALCEERLIDWHKKFSPLGISCISITGDSDSIDFHGLSNHNLIITTPEKWDSISRKWKENKQLIQMIKLFMIDEVHLLNEENRGATLEAVVCRMKTIQSSLFDDNKENNCRQNIRFLAVSATFPNIEDLGDWLQAKYYSFENCMRPVKLNTVVLGFNYSRSCSSFKFDISLNYKLPGLILKYSNGKPTLIFCSTRKSVEMAAKHLIQTLTIPLSDTQKDALLKAGSSISDTKLVSGIIHGIGYHHGGLLPETRSVIEQLFRSGRLPVLVTTSTLATGVNLPAHLVIIKSTKFYDKGGFQDYPASALLQMMGRAGRPQFDTEATALILTTTADKAKFEKMVDGKENIESNFHRHLTEHLNAEIVLRTITDLDVAMRWLSSTFLYIRARKNPRHYGIPFGMNTDKIDKKLLEICQIDLNKLVKNGMASMDEDVNVTPTFLGNLMAKYYMSFETVKLIKSMNGSELMQQILSLISKSKEFTDMRLRVDEKKCLNLLNKKKNENSIRYPFNGKIKTLDMKIACIIQAIFGSLEIEDQSILSEAHRIMKLGERICRCLIDYLEGVKNCYSALLNSTVLWKCFRTQLWENSKHIMKQFPGIGLVTSKQFVNAGKTSFEKIITTNPREIEMITSKKPPFGNKIIEYAKSVPRYDMKIEKLIRQGGVSLKITLLLLNPESLEVSTTINPNSVMCLLIGDNFNHILLHERYMHSYMMENIEVVRYVDVNAEMSNLNEVYCNFISEDLVGIDLSETFQVNEKVTELKKLVQKPEKAGSNGKSSMKELDPNYSSYVQTYIDKYMKCKKKSVDDTKTELKTVDNSDSSKNEVISGKSVEIQKANGPEMSKKKIDELKNSEMNPHVQTSSQFHTEYININPKIETSEITKTAEINHFKSFSDEELLGSVELLLEQHRNNEGEKHLDKLNEYSDNFNNEKILSIDLANTDFDEELRFKYDVTSDQNKEQKVPLISKSYNVAQKNPLNRFAKKSTIGTLKKGKIHSVESFENSLFGPKSDALSMFRYQPSKRLAHSSINEDPTSAPDSKRKKFNTFSEKKSEDMMENFEKFIDLNDKESLQYSKSIKWRSPLVYSPPVKFSPKMPSSSSFYVAMPKNDSENSHDWSLNTIHTNNSVKSTNTPARNINSNSFDKGIPAQTQNHAIKFPLSDSGYKTDEKSVSTMQNISSMQTPQKSQQIQDFFSTTLLEAAGYSDKQKKTSNVKCFSQKSPDLNTSVQSVGSYYHDMVAKNAEAQNNTEVPKSEPQKPFFLSQNHVTMPMNNFGNRLNIGVNHNGHYQMSQPVNRTFVPYDFQKLKNFTPNTSKSTRSVNMMGQPDFESSWKQTNHYSHQDNLNGVVSAPEIYKRGPLDEPIMNMSCRNIWPYNFANEPVSLNGQFGFNPSHMPKYGMEVNNSTIPFLRQPSFGRIPVNNLPDNYNPSLHETSPMKIPELPQTIRNIGREQYLTQTFNNFPAATENTPRGEMFRYQLNTEGNCTSPNHEILQKQNEGFFLNQQSHRRFHEGPMNTLLWNTYCDSHRIFNCFYCMSQNHSIRQNIINGGFEIPRQNLYSQEFQQRPVVSDEYLRIPHMQASRAHYEDRTGDNNPSVERNVITNPYAMQNFSPSIHRLQQLDPNFQKSYGMEKMTLPSDIYHQYPVKNDGDSKDENDMKNHNNFMMNKFFRSFDDPMKNQN